jgi:hypothetical protein
VRGALRKRLEALPPAVRAEVSLDQIRSPRIRPNMVVPPSEPQVDRWGGPDLNLDFTTYKADDPQTAREHSETWKRSWDKMNDGVAGIRREIESRFRDLLGVKPANQRSCCLFLVSNESSIVPGTAPIADAA